MLLCLLSCLHTLDRRFRFHRPRLHCFVLLHLGFQLRLQRFHLLQKFPNNGFI